MRKKVLVLGASGMLGIEVIRELLSKDLDLYASIRNSRDKVKIKKYLNKDVSKIKFINFKIGGNYKNKLKNLVYKKDYIVNCIGVIKPYIDENKIDSIKNAIKINSLFPHELNNCIMGNAKIFQIATDCVYDGVNGNYSENNAHNARDIYGKSKSLGEVKSKNFYNIRCSIIGREIKSFKSLLCWFLNQNKNSHLFGFKNHLWNGITTKHFGKIVSIIITKNLDIPNTLHIVPSNIINKFQLLKIFQRKFKRFDLKITEKNAKILVNRNLKTNFKSINKKIHNLLGYKKSPTINQMIEEII